MIVPQSFTRSYITAARSYLAGMAIEAASNLHARCMILKRKMPRPVQATAEMGGPLARALTGVRQSWRMANRFRADSSWLARWKTPAP